MPQSMCPVVASIAGAGIAAIVLIAGLGIAVFTQWILRTQVKVSNSFFG